jgi:hypothetical protein
LFQIHKEERSVSETSTLIRYGGRTIGREELTLVPTPAATETHRPIPHYEIVRALVETLGFRHIEVVHDEYAVSPDGMKVFGVLDLETEMEGCRFSIGLRNSHDKADCKLPNTLPAACITSTSSRDTRNFVRTIWSLSNAFTSALKVLDPIPQFKAMAKLGEFLEARFSQSF